MDNILSSDSYIILRTPSWPYSRAKELSEAKILEVLEDSFFKEALWIASPILYQQAIKWKNGELSQKEATKVIYSLAKYYQRLCTRATPFGLFAGCTTLLIGNNEKIQLTKQKKRFTRLDANFLYKLILNIENDTSVRKHLQYKCNSSLYELPNEYRYHEFSFIGNSREYNVVAIQKDDYLDKVILACKSSEISYEQLVNLFDESGISNSEIEDYINELINSQVIVSNLEPTLLCDDLLSHIINQLSNINYVNIKPIVSLLSDIREDLRRLDNNDINDISNYYSIITKLNRFSIEIDISKLFQVDLYNPPSDDSSFSETDVSEVVYVTKILSALSPQNNSPLKQFINKFSDRYEQEEVPLTVLLDGDVGLGYPISNINIVDTPLIDDFVIKKNNVSETSITELDKSLLQILINSTKNSNYDIDIMDYINVDAIINTNKIEVQPSITCVFNKIKNENNANIVYTAAAGNSAIDYLGRFAHTDSSINEMIIRIANHEQAMFSDYIFADIVHLPEHARIANILLRPSIYPYQIPYLANTDTKFSIQISDIQVSVRGEMILLRSKKLNKYIIPRLNNAHNYSSSKMSIYRFLCDVQNQSQTKLITFDWGTLGNLFKFTPRVYCKKVIICLAKWNMSHTDVIEVQNKLKNKSPKEEIVSSITQWRNKYNIPTKVILSKGDNELLVDFENELSTLTFFDEVKSQQAFILKEFLFESDDPTERVNHYVLNLFNNSNNNFKVTNTVSSNNTLVQRKFLPGSKILYLKFYGGNKLLEKKLLDEIWPLIQNLKSQKFISKWFFIRYADPEFHIRLRLYLTDEKNSTIVLSAINKIFTFEVNEGVLGKIVLDTYNRELERYGFNNIEQSENFFYLDSECISRALQIISMSDNPEKYRWLSALVNVDTLLNFAQYTIQEKYDTILPIRNAFFKEFSGTKELSDVLSKKYRSNKQIIESALFYEEQSDIVLVKVKSILNERTNKMKSAITFTDYTRALSSYIHMTLNRLFLSEQRKHELVIYDFLERYYKSAIARDKKNNKN